MMELNWINILEIALAILAAVAIAMVVQKLFGSRTTHNNTPFNVSKFSKEEVQGIVSRVLSRVK